MLRKLMDQFQVGDLAVADRGFCGYAQIALLLAWGVQSLFRLHQARCADLLRVIAADPVPARLRRREPRALKRRLKCYPLLNQPRHCYREIPHRNKYRKGKPRNLRGLI